MKRHFGSIQIGASRCTPKRFAQTCHTNLSSELATSSPAEPSKSLLQLAACRTIVVGWLAPRRLALRRDA